MARSVDDTPESQMKKYEEFKKAYATLKILMNDEAYLAAYVIVFSILEDRIKALLAVNVRHTENRAIDRKDTTQGLVEIVKKLVKANDISKKIGDEIRECAKERNALLHASMWNLHEFDNKKVNRIKKLVRELDKAREQQDKKYGVTKSKLKKSESHKVLINVT